MTTSEVELLAGKLDKIDDRLRKMEEELAERRGADQKAGSLARLIFGVAGMAAAISAVIAFVFDRL